MEQTNDTKFAAKVGIPVQFILFYHYVCEYYPRVCVWGGGGGGVLCFGNKRCVLTKAAACSAPVCVLPLCTAVGCLPSMVSMLLSMLDRCAGIATLHITLTSHQHCVTRMNTTVVVL